MATLIEIRARIAELRQAIEDVAPGSYFQIGFAAGAPHYHQVFASYVQALQLAKKDAEQWWQRMVTIETNRIGDPLEAEVNVEMRRPAGSAVSPRVVHELRKAWLACDGLNAELARDLHVHPFELTLDWLLSERHEDLAEYLGTLPFLPIAMNDAGGWI